MILYIAQIKSHVASRCHLPLLIASFGQALDHVGLVSKETVKTHYLLAALPHSEEHVAVVSLGGWAVVASGGGYVRVHPIELLILASCTIRNTLEGSQKSDSFGIRVTLGLFTLLRCILSGMQS